MSLWNSLKPVSVVPDFWKEFLWNLTNQRDYKTPLACHGHDIVDLRQYWNLPSQ